MDRFFAIHPPKVSTDHPPPLDANKTIYGSWLASCVGLHTKFDFYKHIVIFIGINDCGSNDVDDLDTAMEPIFDVLHDLYVKAGARNFVLVDVPPSDRSPQGTHFEATH